MLKRIYSDNPNRHDVNAIADILGNGGIAIIPTDTLYAFVCSMEFKKSVESIARLKGFSLKQAKYSMLCCNLAQASEYVRPMDKETFALLKRCLPGPYTFIMDANNQVPRNYLNPNKTIGIRVPANPICNAIIESLGMPLIGTSVRTLDDERETEYLTDPELINELFGRQVDVVVDGGIGDDSPSTVIDCSGGNMEVVRRGKGDVDELE
jgi:tRNA threonylcarbamoyl adenosine modification protein (Sua5/YciO/YrdC/YwlC family)